MSSAELSAPRGEWVARSGFRVRSAAPAAPGAVLGLLLVLTLWSAFDHGAVDEAASARVEVGAALIGLVAAAAWLWTGTVRVRCSRRAAIAVALLGAFCVWSALSVLWSVAPDRTWLEFNRSLLYVLALIMAIGCGASWHRATEVVAAGLLAIGAAVCAYALGQKLLPGLHFAGVVSLDQTGAIPRLQEPLGYWNALALLLALTAPVALLVAADPGRAVRQRIAGLVGLGLLVLTIAFTLSRGGLVALAVALALGVARGGRPLRSLMWLALAVAAVAPALVVGLSSHSLTADGVPLASRERAGLLLLAAVLAGLLAAVAVALRLLVLERSGKISAAGQQRMARALSAAVTLVVVLAVAAVAVSHRGLSGTVSHAWHSFTVTHSASVTEPSRLLSADSANRWVWWKEAAGAFSDRPIGGWGAGSFPVVHLLYRRDTLSVDQPHSVPLQWLAETGLVGTLLAGTALLLLLAAATQAVRSADTVRERAVRAALLAAAAAYAVHCLYDWDWDIPGVTLPMMLCVGVLAGSAATGRTRDARAWRPRPVWLIGVSLLLCLTAASAAIPSLAASRAGSALLVAAGGSSSDLARARAAATLASELDPLSDAGPRAASTIALHQGQRRQARTDLLDAVDRNPTDPQAWADLAYVEIALGDLADGQRAAQRARELDPLGSFTGSLTGSISAAGTLRSAPPQASASASETP